MENVKDIDKIMEEIRNSASAAHIDVVAASNLIKEGKEILCFRKLQGALTRFQMLEKAIMSFYEQSEKNNEELVDKST